MGPELLDAKIERLIKEILRERLSLPVNKRPIPEMELVNLVIQKLENGVVPTKMILAVIEDMEHNKYTLVRDMTGTKLEINER